MYNKDCKTFSYRKVIPQEAIPLKSRIKDDFERYVKELFDESVMVETLDYHSNKRELRLNVYFTKVQNDLNTVDSILKNLVNLVFSEVKIDGEKLCAENYRRMVNDKIREYNGGQGLIEA